MIIKSAISCMNSILLGLKRGDYFLEPLVVSVIRLAAKAKFIFQVDLSILQSSGHLPSFGHSSNHI